MEDIFVVLDDEEKILCVDASNCTVGQCLKFYRMMKLHLTGKLF